jgi:hypothetical protein
VTTLQTATDSLHANTLTEGWLDAVFAATREVRVRTAPNATRRKSLILSGRDVQQLRCLLRLRRTAHTDVNPTAFEWSIELRNTNHRIARILVCVDRFIFVSNAGAATLRDPETLARWLDARGFHAPFSSWKSARGCVRSQSIRG